VSAIRIEVGGRTIGGTLLWSGNSGARRPAMLFVHGWGDTQRRDLGLAKNLAARGVVCLTFNLRGHARTAAQRGTVTRAQNLADLVAAHDVLASWPEVDGARIGVTGTSYGGYLAVLATTRRPVRWLALRAPALYMDADFDRPKSALNFDPELAAYRRRHHGPGDNRALAAAAAFGGDVLLVESSGDTVIPREVLTSYRRAFGAARSVQHEVLDGADHGLSQKPWRRRWGALLVDWWARHALKARPDGTRFVAEKEDRHETRSDVDPGRRDRAPAALRERSNLALKGGDPGEDHFWSRPEVHDEGRRGREGRGRAGRSGQRARQRHGQGIRPTHGD
jgi:dienelactone hydrolase